MSEADARLVADMVAGIRQRYAELGPEGFLVEPERDLRIPFGSPEHVARLEKLRATYADNPMAEILRGVTEGVLEFIEELHAVV